MQDTDVAGDRVSLPLHGVTQTAQIPSDVQHASGMFVVGNADRHDAPIMRRARRCTQAVSAESPAPAAP